MNHFADCAGDSQRAKMKLRKLWSAHHPDRASCDKQREQWTELLQIINSQYQARTWTPFGWHAWESRYSASTPRRDEPATHGEGFTARPQRRAWATWEDDLVWAAAGETWDGGIKIGGQHVRRLYDVAVTLKRTYAAVRKRAERLHAHSYRRT